MVSHSQIQVFAECRRKWLYRYVVRSKLGAPSPAMELGSKVHLLLADFYAGIDWRERVLGDASLVQAGAILAKYEEFWEEDEYESPLAIEVELEVELGGVDVVGIADLVFESGGAVTVVDHKTTGSNLSRWRTQSSIETYHQLLWYAGLWSRATGDRVERVEANLLSTRGEFERLSWTVSDRQIAREMDRRRGWILSILEVQGELVSGSERETSSDLLEFLAPMNRASSCRWCEYNPVCEASSPEKALQILETGVR